MIVVWLLWLSGVHRAPARNGTHRHLAEPRVRNVQMESRPCCSIAASETSERVLATRNLQSQPPPGVAPAEPDLNYSVLP